MNSAEHYRAHIERQRRLGVVAAVPVDAPVPGQARTIEALQRQLSELSAKLEAMEHADRTPVAAPTRIKPVISTVAKYYDVPVRDLVSFRRARALIRPRHVAMYLARALTKHSLPVIGRVFERDHTTILYGCRQIEKQRQRDSGLDAEIQQLIEQLTPAPAGHTNQEGSDAEKKNEEIRHARIHQSGGGL
jgi:hypothetical protein